MELFSDKTLDSTLVGKKSQIGKELHLLASLIPNTRRSGGICKDINLYTIRIRCVDY